MDPRMIDDREVLAALRRAADAAGTIGATARMVADEMDFTSTTEVVAELHRLERAGAVGGETPVASARWYSLPDTPEERAAAEAEWTEATGELL